MFVRVEDQHGFLEAMIVPCNGKCQILALKCYHQFNRKWKLLAALKNSYVSTYSLQETLSKFKKKYQKKERGCHDIKPSFSV